MAVAASDLIGDLIAQTPQGKVLQSKFKGLADIALAQAKQAGCTYADIRFTRATNNGVNANGGNRDFDDLGGFGGGGGRGGGGGADAAGADAAAEGSAALAEAASRQSATVARPASECASSTAASGASRAARS